MDHTAAQAAATGSYSGEYIALLMLIGLAAFICAAMVSLSYILGPKKLTPYKQSPYECGVAPLGDAKERFPIKFYLVAIVFILFDIEVVFLWGWFTAYQKFGPAFIAFSFWEFLIYMVTFIVGYAYVIRVGAIDWDETTSLEPGKLGYTAGEKAAVITPLEHSTAGVGGGVK
jgi:NADH-quinone oxidoreductase subunit A